MFSEIVLIFAPLYLLTRPTSALGAFLIGFSAHKGADVTLSDRATEAEKPIFLFIQITKLLKPKQL
jgi:hypothetical protein